MKITLQRPTTFLSYSFSIWFTFIISYLPNYVVGMYSSHGVCDMNDMPVVLLKKNLLTNEYTLMEKYDANDESIKTNFMNNNNNTNNNHTGQFRMLQTQDLISSMMEANGERNKLRPGIIPGLDGRKVLPRNLLEEQLAGDNGTIDLENQNDEGMVPADENSTIFVYARECNCHTPNFPVVYCPYLIKTCPRPRWSNPDPDAIPGCVNIDDRNDWLRFTTFLIVGLYFTLFGCLCTTPMGSSIIDCFVGLIYPPWNERSLRLIQTRNPARANRLVRSFIIRQQHVLERMAAEQNAQRAAAAAAATTNNTNGEGQSGTPQEQAPNDDEGGDKPKRKPTSLVLRTKIYRSKSSNQGEKDSPGVKDNVDDNDDIIIHDDDDDDEVEKCTICLVPLCDGERVGYLPCSHLFHVECLKVWLQRRNTCPLCQTENIAMPRYDDDDIDKGKNEMSTTDQQSSAGDSTNASTTTTTTETTTTTTTRTATTRDPPAFSFCEAVQDQPEPAETAVAVAISPSRGYDLNESNNTSAAGEETEEEIENDSTNHHHHHDDIIVARTHHDHGVDP